jgi:hypothetical protein
MQEPVTPIPPIETPAAGKKSNGYLIAYLIFQLCLILLSIVLYTAYTLSMSPLASLIDLPKWTVPLVDLPLWVYPVLAVMGILELVCTIALFRWKRWGFWGFCLIAVALLIIYFILRQIAFGFGGLVGVAILFAILHVGDDNKGWPQLD